MLLRKVDMLSPNITLYYKQKNIHSSIISGILTIIAFIFILSFGIFHVIKYVNREYPMAYFFDRYIEDIGTFSLNDSYFFNYIQIIDTITRENIEIDFNKIEIIGVNITIDNYIDYGDNISYWLYGKCDNEINIKDMENLLNKKTFFKYACLKRFYNNKNQKYYEINDNNFEWPTIKYGTSNHNVKFYGVIIKKCLNSTFRINNFGLCSSKEEINKYLNDAYITFNVIDNYVDILNYKNPVTKFIYEISNAISEDAFIVNNLNFNPGLIRSLDNIFFEQTKEKISYFFHENSQTATTMEDTDILCSFFIWMQNRQQFYERRYKKIQDMLSEIGGFANLIMVIARCINYLIARFIMLIDTQELISNIIKKNISVYEKLIKTPDLKKYIGKNNKQQNNDNSNIKIIDSENNKANIIINKENSDKNNNNKIIINRINVINSNIGEETNRMNKNGDNREYKSQEQTFSELKRMSTKRYIIKRDFALISNKDYFNCFNYFFYIIFCKRINSKIKYYEELRRLIISEECLIQNYLNIYKLLEVHNFN